MSLEYDSRRGDKYLLQAGKTKTGKPKYWFGRKLTGTPLEAIPEGYEIDERPENGQVLLRKIARSPISPIEKELLAEGIRRLAGLKNFWIDLQDKSLVVYLPDRSEREVSQLIGELMGRYPSNMADIEDRMMARANYTKMMRFTLFDEDQRLFTVDRWCFRGSIDDWFWLAPPAPLHDLIEKYVPHLGKESFYELM